MSKLGEDGKPIYREDGKILKGKDYFRPNLQKIFSNHFEMVESKLTKDDIFKECVSLFANLGSDSTFEERQEAKNKEKKLLEKLQYIDQAEYEFFMNLDKK